MNAAKLSAAGLSRLHSIMAGYVERGALPGVIALVHRNGETQADAIGTQERGGKVPMRRDTIFRIASMTKPIVSVAALILIEDCRLRLDDSVESLLPELANRTVLERIDGPLEDTVPAKRAITVRDLLTLRLGMGHLMDATGDYPILQALKERDILQGPPHPRTTPGPDQWMAKLATLPLMHQPGEKWLYDLGMDVLGVLVSRAAQQPLETFLQERVFGPLGMTDTGFSVPAEKIGRFATSYESDPETGDLTVFDTADGGEWSQPPAFPSGGGGLVSTADDYLAFCRMLLNYGTLGATRILSRPTVELMTTDQITPSQKAGSEIILGDGFGWGMGISVITKRDAISANPGRFGWNGGLGTSAYSDPEENLVGILMTQMAWTSPTGPEIHNDFWTALYASIDD